MSKWSREISGVKIRPTG